ncbi:SDR family NAD(P)-dependent oxidoreductase [Paenibacillus polymyxa]|uniref:SDR family NAD(P)-dependent oxidoreductase n=1 Tax=Paenibacillus TaxID=44249 RepID=UPI00042EAE48|nr:MULTISPECIES: SDR family oxidoreductase [Paenibacillus]AHM67718.1 short-chain dehydrogenase/reductase sdr [Paenibacillus polymyxa SQR-21]KAF6655769.1 SDR family oxidoreductase [Paenibacillus sp. EKM301P]MEE4563573.1 SDR family oxidoreductase [Paenibacillus polymyxa]RPE00624.1 SDR family oxidoreductase [Paenibacillus polymyxa]UBS86372.1 SDR family oxidoreductase [Paenibacillus polymyxa]
MSTLQDKVIVITGASSGIGALCAQLLSAKGAIPILTARSQERLKQVSAGISGRHELIPLDVTCQEQVEAVAARVLEEYGRVDILLNNAGYGKFEYFNETDLTEFEQMMDVNYMGVVRCIKAFLPQMTERSCGQIVNVASMAGKIGTAKSASYTATKHALLGFSNALRQELRGSGVTVTTINPGPIDTPFFELADPSGGYVRNVGWFMLKPDKVAQHIVRAMELGKEEVNLPQWVSPFLKLYQLAPRLIDRLGHGVMNKK